ncbi:MAG TPA: phage tail protein, partial [Bacilli bacterium]|nr:phage tail protein [Bacilli bacterium]
GTETVTLTSNQLPTHTHVPNAGTTSNAGTPTNTVWSTFSQNAYSSNSNGQTPVNMNTQSVQPVGGGQPHENMMPSLTVSFIISLYGVFPPQP